MARHDPNLAQLEEAAIRLGELLGELTLVGGCAAGLLVTDLGSAGVRPTVDVDLVVEAWTYVEYESFAQRLVSLGFDRAASIEAPLCRWHSGSLTLDVMPLDEKVLGFTNRWYASAIETWVPHRLPGGRVVHHIDAPHFLASKLEAFSSRGGGDHLSSHDLEDMVRVIDGRESIVAEFVVAPPDLQEHVRSGLASCLAERFFVEALPGYFPTREEQAVRSRLVLERMRRLVGGTAA